MKPVVVLLALAAPLLLAAEAPSAATDPPAQTVRNDTATGVILDGSRTLLVTRGKQTENLVVRYVAFIKSQVLETATPAAQGSAVQGPAAHRCQWTFSAYVQRDICFASIAGLTGCTPPVSVELPQSRAGEMPLETPDQRCDRTNPLVGAAAAQVDQSLREAGQKLFDNDLRTSVKPAIVKSGAQVR